MRIAFSTIFLDIMSFSLIFPLFPQLSQYYLEHDRENIFLQIIVDHFGSSTIIFGGIMGSIYSLLQFFAAPLWGGLSDKIGRRPVLLISTLSMAISYALWIFAHSFTLLLFARFLGGIMGGNISVATAVVADSTDSKSRSKGMAVIGMAFALGFILGPALGGVSSLIRLDMLIPSGVPYGINPFSTAALLGCVLSLLNLYILGTQFQETLPSNDRNRTDRAINIFKILAFGNKEILLCCLSYFCFVSIFSGMEFTLTFLATERFLFSSFDNAKMFVLVGIILIVVQGGIVRKKASQVGEKKMAMMGFVCILPGLTMIGVAKSLFLFYGGLIFLSIGSSMVIPCLTALVSLYTKPENQGKVLGIFRSLGALARVFGPLLASFFYWGFSSAHPYYLGSIFLLIPLVLTSLLPKIKEQY